MRCLNADFWCQLEEGFVFSYNILQPSRLAYAVLFPSPSPRREEHHHITQVQGCEGVWELWRKQAPGELSVEFFRLI